MYMSHQGHMGPGQHMPLQGLHHQGMHAQMGGAQMVSLGQHQQPGMQIQQIHPLSEGHLIPVQMHQVGHMGGNQHHQINHNNGGGHERGHGGGKRGGDRNSGNMNKGQNGHGVSQDQGVVLRKTANGNSQNVAKEQLGLTHNNVARNPRIHSGPAGKGGNGGGHGEVAPVNQIPGVTSVFQSALSGDPRDSMSNKNNNNNGRDSGNPHSIGTGKRGGIPNSNSYNSFKSTSTSATSGTTESHGSGKATEGKSNLYQRTKMCKFQMFGVCKYGGECKYAHSVDQIERMPDFESKWTRLNACPISRVS